MSTIKLQVNTKDHRYPIFIGSGLITKLSKLLNSNSIKFTKCLIVIDNKVSKIFINTNLAACGGVMANAIFTRLIHGRTDVIHMLNGAIAGLVAITAEPLTPSPFEAILIGGIGGLIAVFGTQLLYKYKI